MTLRDVTDDMVARACEVEHVTNAGLVCRNVFRWTESETAARVAQWLSTTPLRVLIILIFAFVVNRVLRQLIRRFMRDLAASSTQTARNRIRRMTPAALRSTTQTQSLRAAARVETIGAVMKSLATLAVYAIATMTILAELGINLAPLIAGAGIVGVAVGFGAQSLVRDFLSGLFILAEDQYGVGDVIDFGEQVAEVEAVNLRTTRLRGLDGTVWHVPNGEIHRVGNMSQNWARALLDVQVAYSTDLDHALTTVKEVADGMWTDDDWKVDLLEEPEVWGVQELGADGITIRLVIKTKPGTQWRITRELNRRMKARFDELGIEIPFPQRVTWLRREGDDAPGDRPDESSDASRLSE